MEMVQISATVAAIVIMGVANIGMTYGDNSGKSDSISVVTAQFIQDTMPELENWRWPPGGHYLIAVHNKGSSSRLVFGVETT